MVLKYSKIIIQLNTHEHERICTIAELHVVHINLSLHVPPHVPETTDFYCRVIWISGYMYGI